MDEKNDILAEDLENEPQLDTAHHYFGNTDEVLARYAHCALCGSNLHFSYITDFTHNLTHEMAQCPECGTKVRKLIHKLQ
ncbi:MAG: hypothetical protein HY072_07085 [Deltaproteobacteria bacterium]|nr:hypothetical protein [Deltaproteobacteria bacterium]